MKNSITILLLAVLVVLLFISGCGEEQAGQALRPYKPAFEKPVRIMPEQPLECMPSETKTCANPEVSTIVTVNSNCEKSTHQVWCPFGCEGGECKEAPLCNRFVEYESCIEAGIKNPTECLEDYCLEERIEEEDVFIKREGVFKLRLIYPRGSSFEDVKEEVASKIIACSNEILSFFGKPRAYELTVRYFLDPELQGKVSHARDDYVYYRVSHEDFPPSFIEKATDDKLCIEGHELTHAIGWEFPAGVLREGFAEFVDVVVLGNIDRKGSIHFVDFACTDEGWCGKQFIDGEILKAKIPYMLTHRSGRHPHIYASGMCLWTYVQEEFGLDKIEQMMNLSRQVYTPSINFREEVFIPVMGTDVAEGISEKFDYFGDYSEEINLSYEVVDGCQAFRADWWPVDPVD